MEVPARRVSGSRRFAESPPGSFQRDGRIDGALHDPQLGEAVERAQRTQS